ncbi:MAG: 4Fe-4S dicluster domain-containing protein [Rhodobacteraceae bacterium]|nr:4Fe-4S dicluster domain-containing protein [Paracoccaceae bacterium]
MSQDEHDKRELDRRSFFRLGVHKAAKAVVDRAEARLEQRAVHYIRPPFALGEVDFLLACTRCHDCIAACPHDVIFPLSARLGIEVVSTPALDLLNGACHLCEDWPCVNACEPKALKLPELEEGREGEDEDAPPGQLPRLAEAQIDPAHCLPYSGPECGACASVCPVPDAIEWDRTRPSINTEICAGCALCRQACITDPNAVKIRSASTFPADGET